MIIGLFSCLKNVERQANLSLFILKTEDIPNAAKYI